MELGVAPSFDSTDGKAGARISTFGVGLGPRRNRRPTGSEAGRVSGSKNTLLHLAPVGGLAGAHGPSRNWKEYNCPLVRWNLIRIG